MHMNVLYSCFSIYFRYVSAIFIEATAPQTQWMSLGNSSLEVHIFYLPNKSAEAEKNRMLWTFFRHFRKLLPFSMLCAGCTNMEAQTMAQYASRKFSKLYDKSYCVCLNFIKTNLFLICISTLPCIAKWIEASLGEWISNSEFQWYHLSMPEMPYCNFRWRTA